MNEPIQWRGLTDRVTDACDRLAFQCERMESRITELERLLLKWSDARQRAREWAPDPHCVGAIFTQQQLKDVEEQLLEAAIEIASRTTGGRDRP